MQKKAKGIVLYSGGLDSTLALHIMRRVGVEVIALVIRLPFLDIDEGSRAYEVIMKNVKKLNIKIRFVNILDDYLPLLKNPKYGFGSAVNPCIDCKILMLKIAKKVMEEEGADFIVTGDVVDERPFSQRRRVLSIVDREAGVEGLVLRPLSGKLLPPTVPEKAGLIRREDLLDIRGRSRKRQLELARNFGISSFLQPAGGCILTDPAFARRFNDMRKYNPDFTLKDFLLLKLGRHFRLENDCKIVIGRNENENRKIIELIGGDDIIFNVVGLKGPIGVYLGVLKEDYLKKAASIIASYSKVPRGEKAKVRYWSKNGFDELIEAEPFSREEAQKYIIK